MWKGIAFYRAQDFESAASWFARLDTPEAYFNLGNAYAQAGELQKAIRAYDRAIALAPRWTEAQENRAYVETLIPKKVETPVDDRDDTGSTLPPDEVVLDETGERTGDAEKTTQVAGGELSDEQISELWMRRVQTTPADFLSQKFAYQLRARRQDAGGASP
jgi:Ca-activated chloride channel family protein